MTGKNYDGCWNAEDLRKQVRNAAIPIFNAEFPNEETLFAFANTTRHAAFAEDTLVSRRMNLGPGGKQTVMRNGMFGAMIAQFMVFPTDDPQAGQPKSISIVLLECSLWTPHLCLYRRSKCRHTGSCFGFSDFQNQQTLKLKRLL